GKERGLSERSEFRSARCKLKRTEQPQANTAGWPFFWTLFFGHSKKRVSPYRAKNKVKPNCRLKKVTRP
ncbi:MAG: hypothetical protein WBM38_13685, partial [Arenicellales bacterium]